MTPGTSSKRLRLAVSGAQARADADDRRFQVWRQIQHTTGAERFQVRAFGDPPPATTGTYRTLGEPVYVAIPGHTPEYGDGRTPYYCEHPDCRRLVVPGIDGRWVHATGVIVCFEHGGVTAEAP